ncbi:SprT-like family-domain-containing protein [Xylariaceae sp. FL0016]|nr:SprT-like family-domain-containing protein [Xylariaceae sp. FL0016]
MVSAYDNSSDDELPELEDVVRKYKKTIHCPDGSPKNPATANTSSGQPNIAGGIREAESAPPPAKATPLRRRKLGGSQTVSGSLLQPYKQPGTGAKPKYKATKPKMEGSCFSSMEDNVEATSGSTNELIDRFPVKAQRIVTREISVTPNLETEEAPVLPQRRRRLISRGQRSALTKAISKDPMLPPDSPITSQVEEEIEASVLEDESESSDDGLSDFVVSDSDSEENSNASSNSDRDLAPRPRRSESLLEKRRIPRRVLSASGRGRKEGTEPNSSTEPGEKEKQVNPENPRTKQKKGESSAQNPLQRGSLEQEFHKLQIFNEDSEPEEKITHKKGSVLEPATPRKTLAASPFKAKIPLSPYKHSDREFWDPEVNFAWIDKHSPPKKSPKKLDLNKMPRASKDDKVAVKLDYGTSPEKRNARKQFDAIKESLARDFLRELDDCITQGRLASLTECTGGLRITWSNTLLTTAGRAHWKCRTVTSTTRLPDGSTTNSTTAQHYASIELAAKVLSNTPDLLNTVAHEFCHLAVFILDGKPKMAHGAEFKAWGRRCGRVFGDRGINVITKHSYEIEYKYIWRCEGCACEVKRHSKSVNPIRQRCGACRGMLIQVKPVPRGRGSSSSGPATNSSCPGAAGADGEAPPRETKKQSAWQEFTAKEMKALSSTHRGLPFKEQMAIVSARWKAQKERDQLIDRNKDQEKDGDIQALTSKVEVLEMQGEADQKVGDKDKAAYDIFA